MKLLNNIKKSSREPQSIFEIFTNFVKFKNYYFTILPFCYLMNENMFKFHKNMKYVRVYYGPMGPEHYLNFIKPFTRIKRMKFVWIS